MNGVGIFLNCRMIKRRMAIESDEVEPTVVNEKSIGHLTSSGIPLGRTGRPGPEYDRLFWRDWAQRVSASMASSGVPPCFRWFPKGSWSARILPPAEGSIDRVSFSRVVNHLIAESPEKAAATSFATTGHCRTNFRGNRPSCSTVCCLNSSPITILSSKTPRQPIFRPRVVHGLSTRIGI
jgi:hypothetical protein